MSDIFISYASEDRKLAQKLAEELEKLGWSVWWDRTIPAGKIYDEVIEEALANAHCVLVLWSSVSVKSNWVRLEAGEGNNRSILIPVLISQVEQPLAFRLIQAADLIEWDGSAHASGFCKLVKDLSNVIGNPPIPVSMELKSSVDQEKRKKVKSVKTVKKRQKAPESITNPDLTENESVTESYNKALEFFNLHQYENAATLFLKAAEQGKADAQNILGWMYQIGNGVQQNDKEAVDWYRKAAEKGYGLAQNNLGWMYQNGRGVPQNDKEAVEWYVKAAGQGEAIAQNNLGWMYQSGRGLPQSDKEAVEWYRKSAEQGNADAQNSLGNMYVNGRGVPQSDKEAVEWYHKSAEQGNADAQNNLGSMFLWGRGIPQSDKDAVDWYRKAAGQGLADAQNNFGWMYVNGRGVPQSDKEAVDWYRKAAEQGYAYAQNHLGNMYVNGRGVPQSDKEAVEWYRKAAGQGLADAQNSLGSMYVNGRGVPQSDNEAVEWYRKAAGQGHADAQKNLSWMCENGRGVPRSDNTAKVKSLAFSDAKLRFVRNTPGVGMAVSFKVSIDGTVVGKLPYDEKLEVSVKSGKHYLEVTGAGTIFGFHQEIVINEGQMLSWSVSYSFAGGVKLTEIPAHA